MIFSDVVPGNVTNKIFLLGAWAYLSFGSEGT